MIVNIIPSALTGSIQAPASKSSMQRACAAALLSHGRSTILNPGHSNDDLAALDVIVNLGAKIKSKDNEKLVIESNGVAPLSPFINCGESGLGIRMFTPLAALSDREITIGGSGSLLTRPMHFFDEIFPQLGISVNSNNGHLPITIKGPLVPASIEIDGSLSSQFLTGLLMAFAAAGADGVEIRVQSLKSRPYIDLTLDVMRKFGVSVVNENYEVFRFASIELPPPSGSGMTPGDFVIHNPAFARGFMPAEYQVEGDWSGGAFLLVAGAIAGVVEISGLSMDSSQADKSIMHALRDAGADVHVLGNGNIRSGPALLKAFDFDATDCPDLFPPLAALGVNCEGASHIRGVSRLAHKESNRGITLKEEFAKMGARIDLDGDIMTVHGGGSLRGAVVHSRHDHRIAMACAAAALNANGATTIDDADAVQKSYPDFFEDLMALGANINYKIS